MNTTTTARKRESANLHYAKLIAIGGALLLASSLLMPFVSGPFGVSFSGWQALKGAAIPMGICLLIGFIAGIGGAYKIVCGSGIVAAAMLGWAAWGIQQVFGKIGTTSNGEEIHHFAAAFASLQFGFSWGAMVAIIGTGLLITTPFFYRKQGQAK